MPLSKFFTVASGLIPKMVSSITAALGFPNVDILAPAWRLKLGTS